MSEEYLFMDFYEDFRCFLNNKYHEDGFIDIYNNRRAFTELIEEYMKNYVWNNEELVYSPEYYNIDHTWWKTTKCKKDVVNLYDWSLKVVVEHENDWLDWTYEVAKLDFIKAPLKIVIGYMANNKRKDELTYVREQYDKLKCLSDTEEFGLILINKELTKKDDPFDFRVYRFTKDHMM